MIDWDWDEVEEHVGDCWEDERVRDGHYPPPQPGDYDYEGEEEDDGKHC